MKLFSDFEDAVVTIAHLLHDGDLESSEDCHANECWCTVQIRSGNHSIAHLLEQWHLQFEKISLETFGANSDSLAGTNLPGQNIVEMYVLKPKQTLAITNKTVNQ